MYIFTTLEFPTHHSDFHLLTTSVNAKYYYKYTLILHRHYHLINIYTELAPKLSATASVAQLVEIGLVIQRSRVRFPAGRPWSCIFRNWSRFGSYNVYIYDTRILYIIHFCFHDKITASWLVKTSEIVNYIPCCKPAQIQQFHWFRRMRSRH